MKYPEYKEGILSFSQISFILKENRLLSFAEKSPERFLAIIKRLEKKDSKIKKENIQYLLLSLLDYLVDYNFLILEKISDEIEDLEDEIINNASKESIAHVHNLKRTLMEIKKNIWPMRELLNTLINSDTIEQKYHIYYRDVYENIINIIDIIEGNRDTVSSFIDIYLSSLSNRMNEIMKTLSIISTIFIPLSFLTGYFGMNFKYQTVLESESIYNWSNALMILIPIILLAYFKLRKWF
jgi:magnesium transporter